MNKRAETIRGLFARPTRAGLSPDNPPKHARAPSGPVRPIKDSFSKIERENETLRAKLADAVQVVEIPAEEIDPSPYADRFAHDAACVSARPDERFIPALSAAKGGIGKPARDDRIIRVDDVAGVGIAQIRASARDIRIALSKPRGAAFARFLAERLPGLWQEFGETESAAEPCLREPPKPHPPQKEKALKRRRREASSL